ncbi:MAG: dihydropteroate synthase, partial [Actinomycetota bacterium]|nr:dihydropteroate synthase [Actinomycetota bacterium]
MPFEPITWDLRTRSLTTADHTLVMGILNVTPDSFSDGGRWTDTGAAINRGRELAAAGADIVDIGGESTRPGAEPVDAAAESARVIPVVEALATEGIVVSIDTSKPPVADAAIDAGAEIVNDVTGLSDPVMVETCVGAGVGVVIMHMLGDPRTMQSD